MELHWSSHVLVRCKEMGVHPEQVERDLCEFLCSRPHLQQHSRATVLAPQFAVPVALDGTATSLLWSDRRRRGC